jgi:hypothetical protein
VPPLAPPMMVFAQKLSDPPSPPNVQQRLKADSVQSASVVQRRTVSVPVHVKREPSDVAHPLAAAHTTEMVPVEQLGTDPPVTGIVPQQTSDVEQPAGDAHAVSQVVALAQMNPPGHAPGVPALQVPVPLHAPPGVSCPLLHVAAAPHDVAPVG